MSALIVITSLLAYAFVAGFIGSRFYRTRTNQCDDCQKVRAGRPYAECYKDHAVPACAVGVGWPAMLPVIAGILASDQTGRAERRERKHDRRMAELAAEKDLAREQKEKTMADIRFLAENGIKADVPGLYEES